MNRVRFSVLAIVMVAVGVVAATMWGPIKVQNAESEEFSAKRVVKDIEVLSRKHHSVAHPEERAEVREYLISRLEELGADTVKLFSYPELTGPENKHVTYTFDATNILAEFAPTQSADEEYTSLMLVAHYDSRYSQPMPRQDTVWSYGAADDGYGIGVILETVAEALESREAWKQGVKVLFTDAEEVGMKGMKAMWESDREQFDNVGLMINLEARGPYGPALLFETSPGNELLMKLYSEVAESPCTYSLTTVVYSFMPNFTDFTIVKDTIPGFNFSTIADINHYHTDLDNFTNVNPRSIQHYGAQIVPIVERYLTSAEYADSDSLKSESDTVSFTLPLLGLFNFSSTGYWIVNIAIFLLFITLFAVDVMRGRVEVGKVLCSALWALVAALGALITGELIAWISSLIAGAQFKPFGIVQGIGGDNVIMLLTLLAMVFVVAMLYLKGRRAAVNASANSVRKGAAEGLALRYATTHLYGVLVLQLLLSLVLIAAIGENLMFFIPLFAATVSILLYHVVRLKEWYIFAIALLLLHAISFLYALAMALTIGAFGAVMMLALLDSLVLVPLIDIYVKRD